MPDHAATPRGLLPEVRYTFTARDHNVAWRVRRVALREALSELYELRIELVSDDPELDPEALLGADACLTLARDDHPARDLLGLILRVEQLSRRGDRQRLRLTVGPALALLGHQVDTRAFQHQNVPQIVEAVLEDSLAALGRSLRQDLDPAAYPAREYCVQYRESHLDFVRRLLHDEGIGFRFAHLGETETLVLFDDNARCPAREPVRFLPRDTTVAADESVDQLGRSRHLTVTGVTQRDWVPLAAAWAPFTHTRCARDDRNRERILYTHDDHRSDADDAGTRARRSLEQHTLTRDHCTGSGDLVDFSPGLRFALHGHPEPARDRSYLLLRVEHHGEVVDAERLGSDPTAPRYHNRFTCVPEEVPFRPPPDPHLQRPRVHGPHTAIVIGPEGEEIHTDEHGRIQLRFHWDRDSPPDDRASCWVRVAQTWAGAGWGALFLPRVGMEVLVHFIDGDPDRPLVVGCVYNSLNTPPVALPDDKTCSVLASESSPGGGLANQIHLEDGRGRESLTLRTRRDLHTIAGHDHSVRVAHDLTAQIGQNHTTFVGANQITAVTANADLTVSDGDLRTTVLAGTHTLDIHGDQHTVVRAGNHHVDVECGGHHTHAQQMLELVSHAANIHLQAHGPIYAESQADELILDAQKELRARSRSAAIVLDAATRLKLKTAAQDITVHAHTDLHLAATTGDLLASANNNLALHAESNAQLTADKISIVANDTLELRVGGTSIVLKPGSIEIKSPVITSTATGEHTISGALIRLN
ncbi:type VI secretion system tip protein TssI/VgrG [Nannocystis sp.]|uniref:type VI secretion system Vgr family protein n=1 Tax=Nannocystis sp. TaxID=1962667 RepID=UPI0025D333E2|nr:type VI secretion system tip protein TssI/VgrG [Nannocystis sp.]MBK7825153.1 type VI secretion system tip protein VgrG [Nannocystis sp.]